jgi:hypothetical protein
VEIKCYETADINNLVMCCSYTGHSLPITSEYHALNVIGNAVQNSLQL